MPLIVSGTDSITLPVGTTAQRNATPVTGMYRLNSTTGTTEYYNGTNWVAGNIVSGTAVASTSGTSIDFTGIPAGVKRITIIFAGVSTTGTSIPQIQIGTSGGIVTTGYSGGASTGSTAATSTTGFIISGAQGAAAVESGAMTLYTLGSNIWVASVCMYDPSNTRLGAGGGYLTLGGTLDRVRITTQNGTDTFDAGSINILYE